MSHPLVTQFNDVAHTYGQLASKIKDILSDILLDHGINVHSITCRTKTAESLLRKIEKKNEYSFLSEITDLAGIRITTYFSDDVDKVIDIIEREFKIDVENSVDKREIADPERFGYISSHHIISLNANRSGLVELKKYADLKIEIQSRSILQHAWAEIEHDLGYKTKVEIPKPIRRKFSRLAGLLEIADEEFSSIKTLLRTHNETVASKLKDEPELVELDNSSIKAFFESDPIIRELDMALCNATELILRDNSSRNKNSLSSNVAKLKFVGIDTIALLQENLMKNRSLIITFATSWTQNEYRNTPEAESNSIRLVSSGISLFYLCYVMLAQKNDISFISEYANQFKFSSEDIGSQVLETYKNISGNL
jgi:putative GTP pyrophosphokinase